MCDDRRLLVWWPHRYIGHVIGFVEDRTQWMVLSAIFNNRLVCRVRERPGSMLWPAAATNIAFVCASGAEPEVG